MTRQDDPSSAARILLSPAFLAGLGILLLNDYYLKQAFPGILSGKISDFAGLFVVALFCMAFLPLRPAYIAFAIGLAFIFWKMPLSSSLIAAWNSTVPYRISRVVDYSDMAAIAALPAALVCERSCGLVRTRRVLAGFVAGLALLGILGTSPARYNVRLRLALEDSSLAPMATAVCEKGSEEEDGIMLDIHEAALSQDLVCVRCDRNDTYRSYKGRGVVLEVNYDGGSQEAYLSLYSEDPYRVGYKDQQKAVESVRTGLLKGLETRPYTFATPETRSHGNPDFVSRLTILSPRKGFPFSETGNGLGNAEMTSVRQFIDEYLLARGFVDAAHAVGSRCRRQEGVGLPSITGYEYQACRQYVAGRVVGSGELARSGIVNISGKYDISATSLIVEFRQTAPDATLDIAVLADGLQNEVRKQVSEEMEVAYEIVGQRSGTR